MNYFLTQLALIPCKRIFPSKRNNIKQPYIERTTMYRNNINYPSCPVCHSNLTYHDGIQLVCPECTHEWLPEENNAESENQAVFDVNGTPLNDGDSVILIKDLKIKGSSQVIKQGTKVKSIRLQDGDHNIACKIEGSAINLKSEFVKKS